MMISRRSFSLASLGLAVLPAACASTAPVLYTLDAAPGAVLTGAPRVIILQDVGLAPYLNRKPIVRSSGGYQIAVETNNWWGETLSSMIGRVLVAELDQRLPASQVFSESSTVTPQAQATVALNVTRFDRNESGAVVLAAQLEVTRTDGSKPPVVDSLRFVAPASGTDIPSQVQAMSVALGQLADAIAQALAG
ncbi:membrane integrity-associated transporter subunit PqiC [Acidisoma cellulosilytica]|uniref:Membrane integrity-associated transporter subunit PqiC n=1 Tax=Acidisoma cellulosilyticum TaxID=2802395 RepID=A0A963YZE5_9PROT|nr:PqiC family protein [Acidisoma cellulosilyticum]MCB8879906.1 membrane integrity-associated transporter subunit PqiC [Acidisoma cellulosilyticum]